MEEAAFFINQVARIVESRDRSSAEKTLVGVLNRLLPGSDVALFEVIEVDAQRHCFVRAHILDRVGTVESLPLWYPASNCPLLSDFPYRQRAVDENQPVRFVSDDASPRALVVPMVTQTQQTYLLEISGLAAWTASAQQSVEGCLKIFYHFLNLLDYGERDTLTGLLNRKSFDEAFFKMSQMEPEVASGDAEEADRRYPSSACWMAVIDIDHFKRVNDTFGHLIGDEVLLLVAGILQSTFRQEDRVYRFGGEEFVVLLRAPDVAWATAALERLRLAVQAHRFPQVEHVTVSVGFSMIRRHDTPSGAFDRADQAVYQAKSLGRNRICSFEMLGLSGRQAHALDQNTVELF
jgi:diguanylate cyclase (GGDEF)-like protein